MKITESDLMEHVRDDFNSLGYATYAEVTVNGTGGKRCDMYARLENESSDMFGHTIVFEAKLTLNIKVLHQLYLWKPHAHLCYIVVPITHKNTSIRNFARVICQKLGLGVIEVNLKRDEYKITVNSEYNPYPKIPKLFEAQKGTISSTNNGGYVTAFKNTLNELDKFMEDKESHNFRDIFYQINHHYKTINSACSAIKKYIERGIITNYIIKDKLIKKL